MIDIRMIDMWKEDKAPRTCVRTGAAITSEWTAALR
jgi:hypothetical protein